MDCRLQVFPIEGDFSKTYRFAVVDFSRSEHYPSNFVCMLPQKLDQRKGKITNIFGRLFGDNGLDLAIELLTKALKSETDAEIKSEIERRLKLIDPERMGQIKCSECKKVFQPRRLKRYKQYFCPECVRKRFRPRQ